MNLNKVILVNRMCIVLLNYSMVIKLHFTEVFSTIFDKNSFHF